MATVKDPTAPAEPTDVVATDRRRPTRVQIALGLVVLGCIAAIVAMASGVFNGGTDERTNAPTPESAEGTSLPGAQNPTSDASDAPRPTVPTAAQRPTPATLAELPSEFPTSVSRSATAAETRDENGRRIITLIVPASTTPAEDLFALSQRLQGAGWQVDPPSQQTGFAFTGFGWRGQARPSTSDGTVTIELSHRRSSEG